MKYKLLFISIVLTIGSCTSNKNYELAPNIYILDKVDPIVSFEDLTNRFKGKPIYIDRWASWCNPCMEEFKHNEALHKFLDSNKIEIVYLNSDTDLDENEWFDLIIDHNLIGNHLRLDSILKADLIDKGIFIPMIPQYCIVNEEGLVVSNKAKRPSDGINLYNQLDSLLRK
ncbi:MAG: redoxin family protein [Bacteroidales bacterium]|jgi:thiol-disulfide isomerase/thioredoxin|nr:redoxin family protein [Bacteroidales bacterium]